MKEQSPHILMWWENSVKAILYWQQNEYRAVNSINNANDGLKMKLQKQLKKKEKKQLTRQAKTENWNDMK